MSALLQGVPKRGAAGSILIAYGTLAPAYVHNGIPYEATGRVAVQGAVPTHYHQGLGFTAVGRLSVTSGSTFDHWGSGAAPFSIVDSLLAADASGSPHYANGVAYNTGNFVQVTSGNLE